jgi:protein-S-isoprenylcysteine O-methyltransferase Ste14
MPRAIALAYGSFCYVAFFLTFLYAIGFLANLVVPKSIDSGAAGPVGQAVVVNLALLSVFALQHSIMARQGFKRVWTRIVPKPVERATYVLASSAAMWLLFAFWQPIPAVVWSFDGLAGLVLMALFLLGVLTVLYSTFLIDHFDLFGLRQVVLHFHGKPYTEKRFATPSLYRHVRHPLYVGWFMTFWFTPQMSVGHLLFASVASAYILVAVLFEESDLLELLGEDYRRWRERTPAFIPRFGSRRKTVTAVQASARTARQES